jgi:hypothetical protein
MRGQVGCLALVPGGFAKDRHGLKCVVDGLALHHFDVASQLLQLVF